MTLASSYVDITKTGKTVKEPHFQGKDSNKGKFKGFKV